MKIAHIINPVKVAQTSDLYIAQPVTFETMKIAKQFAERELAVELLAACYPEDKSIIPDCFTRLKDLSESVLDVIQPDRKRKLPLIKEILDSAFNYSDADYFVYSNVDIAPMPQFYIVIKKIIEQGFDAFVINRRSISNNYTDIKDIHFMYSEIGEPHPGFDCFIFKKEMYGKFYLGNACVGANWIGRVLITNLIANANEFKIIDNLHLTFHIGDERSWKQSDYYKYDRHNENELYKVLMYFKNNNNGLPPMLEKFAGQIENINKKIPLYNEVNISQNPIFVVGFTRSGTTLLQSLIATQEGIYTFPETHFFCEYLNPYLRFKDSIVVKECLDEFFRKAREFSGLDIEWYEIDYFKMLADKKTLTEKMLFENIVKHHLIKQLDDKSIPSVTWLEKTPYHGFVMEDILKFYPRARFVSIIRHPLPAIHSTKINIHPNESYEFIANKWKRMVNRTEEFKMRYPEKICSVKYEDLIEDTGSVMKKIIDFLQTNFQGDKLNGFSNIAKHVVKPFEKWKHHVLQSQINEERNDNYLSDMHLKDILMIQNILQEEIAKYQFPLYFENQQISFNRILHN